MTDNQPANQNVDWVDELVPHYGHEVCTSICPNFRAKALIDQAVLAELNNLIKEATLYQDVGLSIEYVVLNKIEARIAELNKLTSEGESVWVKY